MELKCPYHPQFDGSEPELNVEYKGYNYRLDGPQRDQNCYFCDRISEFLRAQRIAAEIAEWFGQRYKQLEGTWNRK